MSATFIKHKELSQNKFYKSRKLRGVPLHLRLFHLWLLKQIIVKVILVRLLTSNKHFEHDNNTDNNTLFPTISVLISALLFCTLANKPVALGESESQTLLRVMCFNIQHGRGMDNVVGLTRTANAIRAWTPDLVAVQEVDRGTARTSRVDQPKVLAELLGMYYYPVIPKFIHFSLVFSLAILYSSFFPSNTDIQMKKIYKEWGIRFAPVAWF